MSTSETVKCRYADILSFGDNPEAREKLQQEAEFLAFYNHIEALGETQGISPHLVSGYTKISIPAYFRLPEHGSNPVNSAALGLLPSYSYGSGYGNSIETHVDASGMRNMLSLPEDELRAARIGKASEFVVAKALNLLDPVALEVTREVTERYGSEWGPRQRSIHVISEFVRGVPKDLNDRVAGEVSDVAQMVKTRGYVDFLDYLVDVKEVIAERVDTIFAHEAPTTK